jgi:hypothetical protein
VRVIDWPLSILGADGLIEIESAGLTVNGRVAELSWLLISPPYVAVTVVVPAELPVTVTEQDPALSVHEVDEKETIPVGA